MVPTAEANGAAAATTSEVRQDQQTEQPTPRPHRPTSPRMETITLNGEILPPETHTQHSAIGDQKDAVGETQPAETASPSCDDLPPHNPHGAAEQANPAGDRNLPPLPRQRSRRLSHLVNKRDDIVIGEPTLEARAKELINRANKSYKTPSTSRQPSVASSISRATSKRRSIAEQLLIEKPTRGDTTKEITVQHTSPMIRTTSSANGMQIAWIPLRLRLGHYLSHPRDSRAGSIILNAVFTVLGINMCVMTVQTMDGPRFAGSSPAFQYLPDEDAFVAAEYFFTMLYLAEFFVRLLTAKSQRRFWQRWQTWVDLLALSPLFIVKSSQAAHAHDEKYNRIAVEDQINMLRVARILRIVLLLGQFDGCQVMLTAVHQAVGPLKITLFFLITVVMVFATAIYYAEPCYDLNTCAFKDIFNTAYFVMVTVATVGYGSQVPSMTNLFSLGLTCAVMVFGSWYISMPLASVGINYDVAWIDYESKFKRTHTGVDQTLQPMESRLVFKSCFRICDNYYDMSERIQELNAAMSAYFLDGERNASELARAKTRSEATVKLLESIMTVLKYHKKLCAEIRVFLPYEALKKDIPGRGRAVASFSSQSENTTSGVASNFFTKAKQVLTSKASHSLDMKKMEARTVRMEIWRTLNHMGTSKRMMGINRVRFYIVLGSLTMFYFQTMPELQHTGISSMLCQRTVRSFCAQADQPGCHVYNANGTVTDKWLDFTCSASSDNPNCYARGYNYGSATFNHTCLEAFGTTKGAAQVCNSRLCSSGSTTEITTTLIDMEPYWVYFEVFFGIVFTVELVLRIYAHPIRKELWKEFRALLDAVVLFPFYVEVFYMIVYAELPVYSIVPTPPSFFSLVRVFKSFRIIKLGEHIPGSTVLVRTAQLVYKRLLIPLFFLFIGCLISGAVMFELERGTECFVGTECIYWYKNVMTKAIAMDFPVGKRLEVQNTKLTKFTDMLRSTWFSLVTFTTVGYGDIVPRTSLGRLFDILGMIFSACYTSMPLTLVGGQFFMCYTSYLHDKRRQSGSVVVSEIEEGKWDSMLGSHQDIKRPSIRFMDMRIINQFILIRKVFHEIIDDLGKLSSAGLNRGLVRLKEPEASQLVQEEKKFEKKITENLIFCNNALMSFSPIVERLLGMDPVDEDPLNPGPSVEEVPPKKLLPGKSRRVTMDL